MANNGEAFLLGLLGTINQNVEQQHEQQIKMRDEQRAFERTLQLQNALAESREQRELRQQAVTQQEKDKLFEQVYSGSKRVQALLPKEAAMGLDPDKIANLEVQLTAMEQSQANAQIEENKNKEQTAKDTEFLVQMVKAEVQDPTQRDRFLSMLQEKKVVLQQIDTPLGKMPLPAIQSVNRELSKKSSDILTDSVSDYLGHQRKVETISLTKQLDMVRDRAKEDDRRMRLKAEADSQIAFLNSRNIVVPEGVDDPEFLLKWSNQEMERLYKANPTDKTIGQNYLKTRMAQAKILYEGQLDIANKMDSNALFDPTLRDQADLMRREATDAYNKAIESALATYSESATAPVTQDQTQGQPPAQQPKLDIEKLQKAIPGLAENQKEDFKKRITQAVASGQLTKEQGDSLLAQVK